MICCGARTPSVSTRAVGAADRALDLPVRSGRVLVVVQLFLPAVLVVESGPALANISLGGVMPILEVPVFARPLPEPARQVRRHPNVPDGAGGFRAVLSFKRRV